MSSNDSTLLVDPARLVSAPRRLAGGLTALVVVGLAAAVAGAFVPVWPLNLLEHFWVQLGAGGAVLVALAAALRLRHFDLAAVATLVCAVQLAPDLVSVPRPLPSQAAPLRVLLANVHTQSTGFAEVRRLIDELSPDVIGLVEVDRRWLDALAPSLAGYAARIEQPRSDNFGVALYARGALTGSIERFAGELPSVVARLAVDSVQVDLVLVHPPPPISAAMLADQRGQLAAVAARVGQLTGPVIVMGDFNATPWSRPFRELVARTGLCDSRAGFGLGRSYPSDGAIVRIPIDHVLTSCSIGVRDRRVLGDVGSDHLPVVVDLAVPR